MTHQTTEWLNIPLGDPYAESFELNPGFCPVCSAELELQEDGGHEYQCGAFIVRKVEGPIWQVDCPNDPDHEH